MHSLINGIVTEALHETDLIAVGKVVEVFEEGLLLRCVFIVVAVLLDTLTCHVLAPALRTIASRLAELKTINQLGSHRVITAIVLVQLGQILLNCGITGLRTLAEPLDHACVPSLEESWSVRIHAVFVLEDLVLNHVLEVLMDLIDHVKLKEVIEHGIKLATLSNFNFIA